PVEINSENASEILDKIEEKNQSVVINEKKMSAPEIMENKLEENPTPKLQTPEPMMNPEPVYDVVPAAEMSAAPASTKENPAYENIQNVVPGIEFEKKENDTSEKTKVAKEAIALQTEVSEKRANYFLSKKEDVQRMGNMDENQII